MLINNLFRKKKFAQKNFFFTAFNVDNKNLLRVIYAN